MKKGENQKKHKVSFCFLILTLIVLMLPLGSPAAPNKIVFGQAIGISGPFASVAAFSEIPIIKLWLEEVNKEGGIYVPEYGKRLPVELLRYDDKGDIPTTLKLFEKLATVDKVDIILPPCATPYGLAVAPLAAKYKYPLVTFTLMTERYRERANQYGYTFITINCPAETQAALRDLMVELGVKKAAIIYVAQEMGIENAQALEPLMKPAGIEVAMFKSYPVLPKDLSPLLKEGKTAGVDAFIAHSSPPDTMLLPEQAKMINFNPKLFYTSVATAGLHLKTSLARQRMGLWVPAGGMKSCLLKQKSSMISSWQCMAGRPTTGQAPRATLAYRSTSKLSRRLD